jgi:large subunit ribosomal protein L23
VADQRNQVIFKVAPSATKPEIKAAVELLFSTKEQKIEVTGVSVMNTHGKTKRAGRFIGQRQGYKKAYVSIKAGQDLNFAGQ